jgi:hypothetical protein
MKDECSSTQCVQLVHPGVNKPIAISANPPEQLGLIYYRGIYAKLD